MEGVGIIRLLAIRIHSTANIAMGRARTSSYRPGTLQRLRRTTITRLLSAQEPAEATRCGMRANVDCL